MAHPKSRQRMAVAMLILCCAFWGVAFPLMQYDLHGLIQRLHPNGVDPGLGVQIAHAAIFCGWRFLAAALVYLLVTWPRQRSWARQDLVGGTMVGAFFIVGIILQITGLVYILPSTSGVITAMVVVFAPLLQWLLLRRRVGGSTWVAALVALAGVAVLSRANPGAVAVHTIARVPPIAHLGELVSLAGTLCFTGQVIALDRYGAIANPERLTLAMFATSGIVSLVVGLCIGGGDSCAPAVIGSLIRDPWWMTAFVIQVVFSTLLAIHLMNRFQPLVGAAIASVIYCLEPAWATLSSLIVGAERLTVITITGAGLTIGATLLVAVRLSPTPAQGVGDAPGSPLVGLPPTVGADPLP